MAVLGCRLRSIAQWNYITLCEGAAIDVVTSDYISMVLNDHARHRSGILIKSSANMLVSDAGNVLQLMAAGSSSVSCDSFHITSNFPGVFMFGWSLTFTCYVFLCYDALDESPSVPVGCSPSGNGLGSVQ